MPELLSSYLPPELSVPPSSCGYPQGPSLCPRFLNTEVIKKPFAPSLKATSLLDAFQGFRNSQESE